VTLTIAIVTFNARDDLERCLGAITGAPPATSHDVVIVDNGSTDGAPEMVAQRFPSMRLIRAAGNIGFGAANNIAIRQSEGDLVLLLNPDTIVPRGAIDRLVAELHGAPDAAAIGPRLVDTNGRAELSFGPMPGPLGEALAEHRRRIEQLEEALAATSPAAATGEAFRELLRRWGSPADGPALLLLDEAIERLRGADIAVLALRNANRATLELFNQASLLQLRAVDGALRTVLLTSLDGEQATLVLLGDDYDGGHKAWVRWPDGRDDIVPGSRVERG